MFSKQGQGKNKQMFLVNENIRLEKKNKEETLKKKDLQTKDTYKHTETYPKPFENNRCCSRKKVKLTTH